MEITIYLRLFRRWLWLIVLAAAVSGSVAFVIARTQPPVFKATATIQIGGFGNVKDPQTNEITTAEMLASNYAALVQTVPVLQGVITKLRLNMATDDLKLLFTTYQIPSTSLLQINVTYGDPVISADIANELANQLILASPTYLNEDQKTNLKIVQDEIKQAELQLQTDRAELSTINANLKGSVGADLAILTARQQELNNEINTIQSTLATLTATSLTLQQDSGSNMITIVEQARMPELPTGPSPLVSTSVSIAISVMLAMGVAFLIEYLNDTIRTPAEILNLLKLPVIGIIAPFGRKRTYRDKLIAWSQPRSTIAEAYRALRVNLLYRDNLDETPKDCHIYVVTSSGPGEDKSDTTANLAITFAITGMRVLLIDTDLRRPTVHQIFNLPNTAGLSNIWGNATSQNKREKALVSENGNHSESQSELLSRSIQLYLSHLTQKTEVPGLDVITAGPTPSNPAELLDTLEMRELVYQLSTGQHYDAIFFDTPPVLVVADSNVVANVTKAQVILVVEAGRTSRAAASRAAQQFTSLSIPIAGVVMNRLNPRDLDSGYSQYYYGYYYYSRSEAAQTGTPIADPNATLEQ